MEQRTNIYLSDYVLTEQVCHYCHKYLSVMPVKVYRNGTIKCGRCVMNDKDGDKDIIFNIKKENYEDNDETNDDDENDTDDSDNNETDTDDDDDEEDYDDDDDNYTDDSDNNETDTDDDEEEDDHDIDTDYSDNETDTDDDEDDAGGEEDKGVDSLFNQIAKRSVFKCINKFDGCTELLKASDVLKHEETCFPKKYTCPICSKRVSTFLLVSHFIKNHDVESFLETPAFMADKLKYLDKHFLFQWKDNLFFVYFKDITTNFSDNDLRDLSLKVFYLGERDYVKGIRANFSYFDGYTKRKISDEHIFSNSMTCQISLDITENNNFLFVTFDINLEKPKGNNLEILEPIQNFKKENSSASLNHFLLGKIDKGIAVDFVGEKMKSLCFQKRDILPNNTFLKLISDLQITDSSTITFKKSDRIYTVTLACHVCSLIYPSYFKFAPEMIYFVEVDFKYFLSCFKCKLPRETDCAKILSSNELLDISFFCVWDCGAAHNYLKLYKHERKCKKQYSQECPLETCFYHSNLIELKNHFENIHSSVIFQSLDDNGRCIIKELCRSISPIKQILLYWCICVHVQFKWEKPFWKIDLSCKILDVKLKALITDENNVFLESFTKSGFIRHHDKIKIYLSLIDKD